MKTALSTRGNLATTDKAGALASRLLRCASAALLMAAPVALHAQSGNGIQVADFNRDGIPDALVQTGSTTSGLVALGSVPYGTFRRDLKQVTFSTDCTSPATTQIGDFNGDGYPDIAFSCFSGSSSIGGVLLGKGDGTFANALPLSSSIGPYFALGDFNNDGKLDIVVVLHQANIQLTNAIQFLAGNGDGTFAAPVSSKFSTSDVYSTPVAVDLNGDGYLDLVVGDFANQGAFTAQVYGNNKDGTFGVAAQGVYSPNTTIPAGSYPASFDTTLFAGSFYGGSATDIAVVDTGNAPGIFLAKNTSTATTYSFAAAVSVPYTGLQSALPGGFTGSGATDLLVSNGTSLAILDNDGKGNLGQHFTALTVPVTRGFAAADANGDGYADLFLASTTTAGSQLSVDLLSGSATATTQPLTIGAGTTAITAQWPGNINFAGSTASATQTVNLAQSNTTLVSSLNPSPFGKSVLFTATVTGAGAVPTGTVTFTDGTSQLGQSSLSVNGTATFSTANLSAGAHSIRAAYSGDNVFAPSTSAALAQQVVSSSLLSISPSSAIAGTASFSLELSGGFSGLTPANGYGICFGSSAAPITAGVFASSEIVVPVPASAIATAGTYPVYVGNSSCSPVSNSLPFTVTNQTKGPNITSLSPDTAHAGRRPVDLTINGLNFINGATVTVSGVTQPAVFVSSTQLTTTLSRAQVAAVGVLPIVVVNPDGTASNTATFSVTAQTALFSSTSLDFGNVMVGSQSSPKVVTLTNTSAATLNISQIALSVGADPADYNQTNNCPAALAPNAACSITITFVPLGVGLKTAALGLYDDSLPQPQFLAVSGTGTGGILQVDPGNLKTIAGNGTAGYSGDDGPATAAAIHVPIGLAFDSKGNLYFADSGNNVVRKVDATTKIITTFAGTATAGYTGDDGPAKNAELRSPSGVAVDASDNVFIQDEGNSVIRKVDTNGIIQTFAGTGTPGFSGDGGPATAAQFRQNQNARFDAAGNLYIPDCTSADVRKIDTNGIITTVAGTGTPGFSGDGGLATDAELQCPSGVAVDAAGNLYIADFFNYRIRKINANTHIITTIAGNGNAGFGGDGGAATAATLNIPNDVDLDSAGNIYIADNGNNRIRKIDAKTGILSTVVGGLNNAGSASVNSPLALTLDSAGNIYFADSLNNEVREVFPAGTVSFPATAVGSAALPITLTLSNIGNLPVNIESRQSFTLGGNSGDFSLAGGTCLQGATLAINGGSCTLQIGFTPTAVGPRTLSVSVIDNAVFSPQTFQVSGTGGAALQPIVTLISPSETSVSASSLPLVVSGSGFVSGSVVLANGTSLATTFVSATQLNATVPAALLAQAGALSIQVQNPVVSGAGGLSATLPLNVVPDLVLSSIAPATAVLNAAATTLTATGSHFTSTTVVQFNGSALATSFVSATRLTAVIPASDLTAAGSYRITTFDPASGSVSGAQSFAVLPNPTVVFTGPPTVEPGGQPPIVFRISESYPVAIDGLLTVSFTPDSGLPQDPMVLFSNNQQTLPFTLAAGSTATPPVLLQAGTTAGTITVSLSLSSGGVPVTQVAPILITVPRSVPNILSATLTRGTRQVTVTVTGYSSTRELTFGGFRFTPANGASFTQTDFALSVTPLFVSWYNDPASLGFGTEFTYTQTFNLSGSSAQIGSVAVTLSNSVGTSTPKTAQ